MLNVFRVEHDGTKTRIEFATLPLPIIVSIDRCRQFGDIAGTYSTVGDKPSRIEWECATDPTGRRPIEADTIDRVKLARGKLFELWGVLLGVCGTSDDLNADLEAADDVISQLETAIVDAGFIGREHPDAGTNGDDIDEVADSFEPGGENFDSIVGGRRSTVAHVFTVGETVAAAQDFKTHDATQPDGGTRVVVPYGMEGTIQEIFEEETAEREFASVLFTNGEGVAVTREEILHK